ncbi:MAG: FtsX-like permease family protein [Demequinaceae bacterium]|nr:FtsX-like permease family protein [Demequinaceae bacterium]
MILRLAVEQVRSQRRYTLWTAALLAATTGLVAFALTMYSTERAFDDLTARANGGDRENHGYATTVVGNVPESTDPMAVHSTLEIDQALTQAMLNGSDVVATRMVPLDLHDHNLNTNSPYFDLLVIAVRGDFDWDLVLAEGNPPTVTQIALSSAIAEELGVGIGDVISVAPDGHEVSVRNGQGIYYPTYDLWISGLLRSNDGLTVGAPWEADAIVSWKLSNDALGLFTYTTSQSGDPEESRRMWTGPDTWVDYDTGDPALGIFVDPDFVDFSTTPPEAVPLALAAAGVLLLTTLGGAFAIGRSLGQARVGWIGTARTLGATRRSIRMASILETLLVGAVATVAGFAGGYLASAIRLAVLRDKVPYPLAPTSVPLPWWVIVGVGAAGLVFSLALSAVPAFWASRVPPVAALKATADLTAVETSRRVPIRWLTFPLAIGVLLILAGGDGTQRGDVLFGVGGILSVPTALAFFVEGFRRLVPVLGRRLAKSRRVWAMVAGDGILARPRQASTLATLSAMGCLVGIVIPTLWAFYQCDYFLKWRIGQTVPWSVFIEGEMGWWTTVSFGVVIGLLVALQAICLAVTLSSIRVTTAERATQQAMGLSTRAGRAAAFAQHSVPQIVGLVVGALTGYGVALFIHFCTDLNWPYSHRTRPSDYLPAFSYSALSCLVFLALGLAIIGLGSILASRIPKERTPVEALRPEGKVSIR